MATNTLQKNNITRFFQCFCHGEAISIDLWDDEELILLSVWNSYCNDPRYVWRERLRWIWHLLRTGEPFHDQVLFDKKTAKELGEYLIEQAGEIKGLCEHSQ